MRKNIYILGINSVYHESSACLLRNGEILFAIEEERLNRIRHAKMALISNPHELPFLAINECLKHANIEFNDLDHIGFSFDPIQRLKRNTSQTKDAIDNEWGSISGESKFYKLVSSIPKIMENKYNVNLQDKWHWISHHICHAASSYFTSPFKNAAILTYDGIGEHESVMFAMGDKASLQVIQKSGYYPNSIGFLWSKASKFLCAEGDSEYGAGKIMALASFGNADRYYKKFRSFIHYDIEGNFVIDDDITQFRYNTHDAYEKLFEFTARKVNEGYIQNHMDFAASLQKITNEVALVWANMLYSLTGSKSLCMAGGVSLNCTTNSYIHEHGKFENIFIQPAANDAGTALGAALFIDKGIIGNSKYLKTFTPYLGKQFDDDIISSYLKNCNELNYIKTDKIVSVTAYLLSKGAILAWFQGRMEFGPRALGNRSILADPRKKDVLKKLSQDIKGREWFRPLASSVLENEVDKWFIRPEEGTESDKWMLLTYIVKTKKIRQIPAVVHIDKTSRVQIVSENTNKKFYNLLHEFNRITGVPILANTSLNVKQPIVNNPQQAIECIQSSRKEKIDFLVMNNYLIARKDEYDLKNIIEKDMLK